MGLVGRVPSEPLPSEPAPTVVEPAALGFTAGRPSDPAGDGCDKSLAWWFNKEPWAKPKPSPKPVKPRYVKLSDVPKACAVVLAGPAPSSEQAVTYGGGAAMAFAAPPAADDGIAAVIAADGGAEPAGVVPVPLPRPSLQ